MKIFTFIIKGKALNTVGEEESQLNAESSIDQSDEKGGEGAHPR